jgi:hypothetical protein
MITVGEGAARVYGAESAKSLAEGFVTVRTAGIRELVEQLQALAKNVGKPDRLESIVRKGAKLIENDYKQRVGDVTGGLQKSVKTKTKVYEGAVVAITGPLQTGATGSSNTQASGNHAWLVEFGSGRRRPGTQGRRTYINVHQMINGKMRRHSSANDQQFAAMSRGYYFLMGSRNEPTRQAREGRGYPHDFGFTNGRQHPITLHPGEDYGAMPAKHPMERTIQAQGQAVYNTLEAAIKNTIESIR